MFNNLKFLFCMKNRVIIDYCSLYLRRKDCSCYTCDRKSEEHYKAIKEKRPHVVMCDKKLEDGMSADVYERLKKEGIEVKFFINSSSYYSLGANNSRTRFYSKPVSPEYVYDEVVKRMCVNANPAKFDDLSRIVGLVLQNMGISCKTMGYRPLIYSICQTIRDPNYTRNITQNLYPELGRKFGTTAVNVERNMRTAVAHAWNYGEVAILHEFLNFSYSGDCEKPTNKEFINIMADRIKKKSYLKVFKGGDKFMLLMYAY